MPILEWRLRLGLLASSSLVQSSNSKRKINVSPTHPAGAAVGAGGFFFAVSTRSAVDGQLLYDFCDDRRLRITFEDGRNGCEPSGFGYPIFDRSVSARRTRYICPASPYHPDRRAGFTRSEIPPAA